MAPMLEMHVEPTLADASMVLAFEGWNDAGESATSAVRYLDDAIRSVPLAEIDGEDFLDFTVRRPTLRIEGGRRRVIDWPRSRFRYGSVDPSRELVTGHCIEPHMHWRAYCELLAELVSALRPRRVILLGAYVADVVYSRPVAVTGFGSDERVLQQIGVSVSSYEGPTGIIGVLAERLARDGVDVLSLWAGLPHYITAAPNPRGALALIQKLTACLGIKVDEEPLRQEAAAFEQRISALVASDPELREYVRQLKRREFAQ
jgi:hypothetical protein